MDGCGLPGWGCSEGGAEAAVGGAAVAFGVGLGLKGVLSLWRSGRRTTSGRCGGKVATAGIDGGVRGECARGVVAGGSKGGNVGEMWGKWNADAIKEKRGMSSEEETWMGGVGCGF